MLFLLQTSNVDFLIKVDNQIAELAIQNIHCSLDNGRTV